MKLFVLIVTVFSNVIQAFFKISITLKVLFSITNNCTETLQTPCVA